MAMKMNKYLQTEGDWGGRHVEEMPQTWMGEVLNNQWGGVTLEETHRIGDMKTEETICYSKAVTPVEQ